MDLVLFPLLILCVLSIAGFVLLCSNARSARYRVEEPLSFEDMKSGLVDAQEPLSFEDMMSDFFVAGGVGCGKSRTILEPPAYGIFNDRDSRLRLRNSTGQSTTWKTPRVPCNPYRRHRSSERSRKTFPQFVREQQPAASQN